MNGWWGMLPRPAKIGLPDDKGFSVVFGLFSLTCRQVWAAGDRNVNNFGR